MSKQVLDVPIRNETYSYRMLGTYRFMLALLVLASHAFSLWPEAKSVSQLSLGNVGVFLFFVLSGFVITEALEEFYRTRVYSFLINRFFKIYPPYWVALALAISVDAFTANVDPSLNTAAGLGGNILLFGQYLGITNYSAISITWAVVIEIQFYLAAAACFALFGMVRKQLVLLAFSFVGLFGYLAVHFTETRNHFFGTLEFAPYFVLGVWLYYLRMEQSKKLPLLLVISSAALAMHAFIVYVSRNPQINVIGAVILLVVVFAALLYLLWGPTDWMNIALDKHLGNATYFLYLIHMPVVTLVERREMGSGAMAFMLAALFSILFAFALYQVIERPIQRLRDRVRGQRLYV
jgi:peptidoglycan/LPS O-acetylase OafA/YrhL